jgi:hypothetical protein
MTANDNTPDTICIPRHHAAALVAAGNVLSELWGDLAAGDAIAYSDLMDRLEEAEVAARYEGVPMLADSFSDAVLEVDVALRRGEGDLIGMAYEGRKMNLAPA